MKKWKRNNYYSVCFISPADFWALPGVGSHRRLGVEVVRGGRRVFGPHAHEQQQAHCGHQEDGQTGNQGLRNHFPAKSRRSDSRRETKFWHDRNTHQHTLSPPGQQQTLQSLWTGSDWTTSRRTIADNEQVKSVTPSGVTQRFGDNDGDVTCFPKTPALVSWNVKSGQTSAEDQSWFWIYNLCLSPACSSRSFLLISNRRQEIKVSAWKSGAAAQLTCPILKRRNQTSSRWPKPGWDKVRESFNSRYNQLDGPLLSPSPSMNIDSTNWEVK